jgi:hypothetical protein
VIAAVDCAQICLLDILITRGAEGHLKAGICLEKTVEPVPVARSEERGGLEVIRRVFRQE